jgi:fucose permease
VTAAPISNTAWRNAIFVVFAVCGLSVATLLARMPAIRDHLGVEPAGIGLMLAFFSVGSILGLWFSGRLLQSLGARRLIQLGIPALSVMLAAGGLAAGLLGNFAATAVAFFLFGACIALTDVASNVEGTANERAVGRSVMPFLHGGFSLGTVVGAALGALAALLDVPIAIHIAIVAAAILLVGLVVPRWIPGLPEESETAPKPTSRERRAVWREPRTLLIGVVVFAFAYIEGAANDWLPLGLVDERGFDPAQGALMLAVFTGAMTVARFAGSRLVDRFGRVSVLIVSGLLAAIGLALVIWVPTTWVIVVGTIIWAFGSALGFPIGMSAAGDDPAKASIRVPAVSVIGYTAFFAGPPVIGLIADQTGILPALTVILGLVVLAIVASPATRQQRPGVPGIAPSAVGADPLG